MRKIVSIIFLAVFAPCYHMAMAQIDTLRGRVPYWHYNFYDSSWCQSQINQGWLFCLQPMSCFTNKYGYHISDFTSSPDFVGQGFLQCFYSEESSEVAIRMEMDSAADISGIVFGYNTIIDRISIGIDLGSGLNKYCHSIAATPYYYTEDYVFNLYDELMNLIWSDTVLTEELSIDFYMEAGFDWCSGYEEAFSQYYSSGQCGYALPSYIGMCRVNFDTTIHLPETFYIGLTSSTPVNTLQDTMLVITALYERYNADSPSYINCIPYESRRYRVTHGSSEPMQDWGEEECRYGVQTCLYPILALPCREVTGLRYEPIGGAGTMVKLEWDGDELHSHYEISYGPAGAPPGAGTIRQSTLPQTLLSQLNRTTHYDVYVRARCDIDTTKWSAWSDTLHVHIASYGIDGADAVEAEIGPNPTSGMLTVRCEAEIKAVELYDMQGRCVAKGEVGTASGEPRMATLRVQHLPAGTYTAVVRTAQGTATKQVMVL